MAGYLREPLSDTNIARERLFIAGDPRSRTTQLDNQK